MPSYQSYLLRPIARLIGEWMAHAPIQQLRRGLDISAGRLLLPRGIPVTPVRIDQLQAEWFTPDGASAEQVLLYLHGGGFITGLYNGHRALIARISRSAAMRALAIDYRLLPEHPFPAALHDAIIAYRWLLGNGYRADQVVVGGDSAGGTLVLTMLLVLRDAGDALPGAAFCLSPVTDFTASGTSYCRDRDPMLRRDFARWLIRQYVGPNNPRLPLISPLYADLRKLPPLLIHVGEDELLLSDALNFTERARQAGVAVTLKVWPRMWHVWQVFAPVLPEARQAIAEIGQFCQQISATNSTTTHHSQLQR